MPSGREGEKKEKERGKKKKKKGGGREGLDEASRFTVQILQEGALSFCSPMSINVSYVRLIQADAAGLRGGEEGEGRGRKKNFKGDNLLIRLSSACYDALPSPLSQLQGEGGREGKKKKEEGERAGRAQPP